MKINFEATGESYVIVGGMSTIGQELSKALVAANAEVYAMDIAESGLLHLGNAYQYIQCQPTDISNFSDVLKVIPDSISGLVCLSGSITHFGSVTEMSVEEWKEVFNISFTSCYNACKLFSPALLQSDKSSIVNMSSGLAFGGQANYGPYTTAKAAINSLSRTLATELAPSVRVNTVAPGAVDTAFIYDEQGQTRFDKERYKSIVPLGALGQPNEICQLILYLLSDGANHITGQCIHINGGAMMM